VKLYEKSLNYLDYGTERESENSTEISWTLSHSSWSHFKLGHVTHRVNLKTHLAILARPRINEIYELLGEIEYKKGKFREGF
jgi:hypothetical protein